MVWLYSLPPPDGGGGFAWQPMAAHDGRFLHHGMVTWILNGRKGSSAVEWRCSGCSVLVLPWA